MHGYRLFGGGNVPNSDAGEEKHYSRGVRAARAGVARPPEACVQRPREQGALYCQERRVQPGAQEHPRAGPLSAGRLHHAGGPQMALHARHFYHDLPVQLAAVRHGLVARCLRARRPGPHASDRRRAVCHQRQVSPSARDTEEINKQNNHIPTGFLSRL